MKLRELHEAATPSPWMISPERWIVWYDDSDIDPDVILDDGGFAPPDAALIVALRNAYADGTLVERSELDEALAMCEWLAKMLSGAQMKLGESISSDFPKPVAFRPTYGIGAYSTDDWLQAAREACHE